MTYFYKTGQSKGQPKITLLDFYSNIKEDRIDPNIPNKVMEDEFNKVLESSGANKVNVIGPISEYFDDFKKGYQSANIPVEYIIYDWKNYYLSKYQEKYNAGLKMFLDYYIKNKKAIADKADVVLTDDSIEKLKFLAKEYFDFLLFNKTAKGLYIEEEVLKFLCEKTDREYRKDYSEESKGIDGYIGDIPVSVKPKSFKGGMSYRGINIDNYIKYCKNGNDLEIVLYGDTAKLIDEIDPDHDLIANLISRPIRPCMVSELIY